MTSKTMTIRKRQSLGPALRGFSLVEVVIAVVIVAVMLTAALTTVAASSKTQYLVGSRNQGNLLAQDLMAEILSQSYEELDDLPLFGRESGEGASSRRNWDDVDDYHGWSSSPPQDKDGTAIPDLTGWTRRVSVEWVNPAMLTQVAGGSTGVKRITVSVMRGNVPMASLVAIRTEAWPQDQQGTVKVLFVVTSAGNPTAQELARQTLMESWGFVVTLINASSPQAALDAAVSQSNVAYISEEIDPSEVGTKLKDVTIGVVNEEIELADEFGFSTSDFMSKDRDQLKIVDNSHYITSTFDMGYMTIFSSVQPVWMLASGVAPGLRVLGEYHNVGGERNNKRSLVVLELGAQLYGGGTAAGRRVLLPWGGDAFGFASLNADGQTLMKRAIEWAANREQQSGG